MWRRWTRTERSGHVWKIPTRRPIIYSAKRWPTLQLHPRRIVLRGLRDPARSRRAVGEAFGRRRKTKMRLAQRQIRSFLASHSLCFRRPFARQRSREIRESLAGDDANGEN